MRRSAAFLALCLGLTGCVSITPRAEKIQLHPSTSNLLEHCERLGPVSAEASAWTQPNWGSVDQQVTNNLRQNAAAKWPDKVDSVALINIDHENTKATANGVAYKCF
ncbi:hypothetical protein ACFPME_11185 [Rhodanobacter umsongensis]|uniref:DUF4156 domain-containing protein n=1 Tax=Rhodanobacter umsongensis TaxID=633153 RepID=A0ABW0JMC4_9GAMM